MKTIITLFFAMSVLSLNVFSNVSDITTPNGVRVTLSSPESPPPVVITTCTVPPLFDWELTGSTLPTTSWKTSGEVELATSACYVFKVVVTAGNEYTFKTGCATGGTDMATADFDTYIVLYNAAGDWITQNDDGCENYRSNLTWTANYSGNAYVKVRGYNSSNYGKFKLAYRYTGSSGSCKTPPGDWDGTITFAASDTWYNTGGAAITINSNDCKVYKLTTVVGRNYTFKTGCPTGEAGDIATADFDTFLELYDASGTYLMGNDDGCENYTSTLTWLANQTTYFVKVRGYNSTKTGTFIAAYKNTVNTGTTACGAIPGDGNLDIQPILNNWQTDAVRSIGLNGCFIYKVRYILGGQIYTFKTGCRITYPPPPGTDGAEADFDTYLELYNASGTLLASNDDGCGNYTSTVSWTANYGTGVYGDIAYLKVRGYDGTKYGSFKLAYKYGNAAPVTTCKTPPDYNVSIATAALGVYTTTAPTTIVSDECVVYRVTGIVTGYAYTFKTGCATGNPDFAIADFDTWIELYGTDGTSIMSNDDGCAEYRSTITWTATYNGVAYVKVRGYNSAKYGTYGLAYKVDNPSTVICKTPPTASPDVEVAASGGWATATNWRAGAAKTVANDACVLYKLNLPSGNNQYTFKTGCDNGASANFDTYIELYDAAGNWLGVNDDGCPPMQSTITWTTSDAVSYIKVRGYNSTSVGTFTPAWMYKVITGTATCTVPPLFDRKLDNIQEPLPTMSFLTAGAQTLFSNGCFVYQVGVTSGEIYTFKTGCATGNPDFATADFDTWIELYDASGIWLTEDDDGCAVPSIGDYSSKIEWTATYSGNAYVKVRGYNSNNFGAFRLAYKYAISGPDVALGTGELTANQIKVYPNPANQSFTVVSQAPLSFTRVTVSEFTGRLVKNWNLDQPATSMVIESADFAPGVYILSIETSEGWIRKKVSIIR